MSYITQLEDQQADERLRVERRDAILRLVDNPDFRKVIAEGFFVTDCARYVRESINPVLDKQAQADALSMAQAAGWLKQFLNVGIRMGDTAANTLRELDEALAEARVEEINE